MADAPIYQLSTELLTEIFLWTQVTPSHLQNHPSDTCYDLCFRYSDQDRIMCTEATTLDISQTCSYWRNIAISIPSLWSRISVDLYCKELKMVDLLRLYIQRSLPVLLTLKLWGDSRGFGLRSVDENAAHILKVVIEQKHRWRVVDLGQMSLSTLTYFRNHFVRSSADCLDLEMVHIPSNRSWTINSDAHSFCDLFGATPKLHTLSSPKPFQFHPFFLETIPLNQVTTIKLTGGFGFNSVWGQFLQSCPNLQILYLGPATYKLGISNKVDPIILPHLQSLNVDVVGGNTEYKILMIMSMAFSPLKAPLLSTLQFRGDSEKRSDTSDQTMGKMQMLFTEVKGFLQRSGCQLRQLRLSGDVFSTQMVIELLAQTRTLEELTVDGGYSRLPLFRALTVSPLTVPLPHLTKLEVAIVLELEDLGTENLAHNGQELDSSLDDAIYATVCSRRSETGPMDNLLRWFRLSVPRPIITITTPPPGTASVSKWLADFRSETLPRLSELTQYGLELELDIREM